MTVDIVTLRLSCDKNYFTMTFNKIAINSPAKFYDISYNTNGIVCSVLASEKKIDLCFAMGHIIIPKTQV